ncbi:four helix bundle protein [Flavobacterium agri]|nr:four helix bundle protein [Flavobacterium agri]
MHPHKKLHAYTLSFEFVKIVYLTTDFFPKQERFGLVSQIRRASVSVPVNIAEGAARKSKKEFIQLLHYSLGSVTELDTLLLLSLDLNLSLVLKQRI